MSIWKQAEGLCLIALSPQCLLQISMQIPASQPCREQSENLSGSGMWWFLCLLGSCSKYADTFQCNSATCCCFSRCLSLVMKSVWEMLSSAGKASMTGAQSGSLGEHNLGERLLIECSVSAAFLFWVPAGVLLHVHIPQWTLAMWLFWTLLTKMFYTHPTVHFLKIYSWMYALTVWQKLSRVRRWLRYFLSQSDVIFPSLGT